MIRDQRGVSTVISHILALGIVAILVVGLVVGVGGLLEGEQATAKAEELDAVGNRLASDLVRADRLATDDTSLVIDSSGPRSITGGQYTVHLVSGPTTGEATLTVSASGTDASTQIVVDVETAIREGRASGDSVSVVVSGGELTIEER